MQNTIALDAGQPLDLSNPIDRKKLILKLNEELDKASIAELKEPPRNHLGASIIGDDCAAKAWSVFRWLKEEQHPGRQMRLFNRGHMEEPRLIRWLTAMGFEVREHDPATGKQFRILGCKGHFGGSLDGLAKAPAHYNLSSDLILLTEYKTHSDKSFTKLKKEGMVRSKPMHFKQMCAYGRAYNVLYGLYVAVNKNDDEIYFEIVVLDYREADNLFHKAETIVFSQTRPGKIANTPSFFNCQYCHFSGICHSGEAPEINCRSCFNAVPVDNGEWLCKVRDLNIPKEVIPVGCPSYSRIV